MVRARWWTLPPLLWAILACGNGMPVDLGQEFIAPMEDPPEAGVPQYPDEVGLPDALTDALIAHHELVFHADSGEGPFCEAMRSAQTLTPKLEEHLNTLSARDEAFTKALKVFDTQVAGVSLRLGSEGISASFAPQELGDHTDGNTRAMLQAASQILPSPFPGWMEPTTSVGGCNDPGRLIEPLELLAERWELASACSQEVVKTPLRQTLRGMVRQQCYCDNRKLAIANAEELAPSMQLLPGLGGLGITDALGRALADPDSRFDDPCGG